MAIESRSIVVGLTAPFGAGSTTAANILADREGFSVVRLSEPLRQKAAGLSGNGTPLRTDLQNLGNQMREEAGNPGLLADMALETLDRAEENHTRIVLDGIRNTGEVDALRDRFGHRFFLFAIECPTTERWRRLQPRYERADRTRADFLAEDERDRNQEYKFGQQVQACVDLADAFLINDFHVTMGKLTENLADCVGLVTGVRVRYPRPLEILMNLAYSAAHGSRCPKRQVGAVIVTARPGEMGEIVGQGFNENPLPTHPCIEESEYGADLKADVLGRCHRDLVREEAFKDLAREGARCPQCGRTLVDAELHGPLWRCSGCKVDLERYFWPERALSLCTAIHAEVAAINAAERRARGATLYTTTFPCFQCAEKITQAGIAAVVFTEPYPDVRAAHRLRLARVDVVRFEGIRSRKFDEIFSRVRR